MSKSKEQLKEDLNKEDVLQRVLDREHDHRVMLDALRHIWTVSKGYAQDVNLGFVDEDPFIDKKLNTYLSLCHISIEKMRKTSNEAVGHTDELIRSNQELKEKIYWLRERLKKYEDTQDTLDAERVYEQSK